jgi:peptidoglycan/LPS O-acetylase OafA/YrhL
VTSCLVHSPAADHGAFRACRYFGSLDGLRCLSIIAVIWHHTRPTAYAEIALLQHGFMGVELFFVISGFLITTLLLRERAVQGNISLGRFYIRRTLRIFPLYYTVLLLYVVMVVLFDRHSPPGRAFFANLPYFASYTSNWFVSFNNDRVIFYFVWSLAAEEQFYLLWPTVEQRLGSTGAVLFMVGLLALVTAGVAGATDAVLPPGTLVNTIITRFPVPIGLGVLLAHALHDRRGYRWLSMVFGHRVSAPLALAVLGLTLARTNPSSGAVRAAMTALVATVVMREDHFLAPFLKWRPIAHVGVVSYGMYLLHMLTCNFARRLLQHAGITQPLAPFVVTTGAVIAVASFSYRYYESVFLRLKERLAPKPDSTTAISAGTPNLDPQLIARE